MASNISYNTNVGGIDWNGLADQLIALEQQPVTLLQTNKQTVSNKKDVYDSVAQSLGSLKTAATTLATPDGITSVGVTTSDSDYLTATGQNGAASGSYQVTINQLATATRITSGFTGQLGITANADLNQLLNTTASHLGGNLTGSTYDKDGVRTPGYITINGTQVTVNIDPNDPTNPATNDTLQQVIDRINSTVAGVTASYDSGTDTLSLASANAMTVGSSSDTSNLLVKLGLTASPDVTNPDTTHSRTTTHRVGHLDPSARLTTTSLATNLTQSSGSFTINGTSISYDLSKDSLNDIMTRINSTVSTVSASYDSQTDRVVLSARDTGSLGISRSDNGGGGNLLAALGLLDNTGQSRAVVQAGQNAKITIPGFNNGNPIYSTSNTVTDAIPGVTLTLKQADLAKVQTVIVTRDNSDLKSKLSDFVTKYNATIDLLTTRLTEQATAGSTASGLSTGVLRGDTMLADIKRQLASSALDVVSGMTGDINRLGSLGITINSTNPTSGELTFDQTKFDKAMADDPDRAYQAIFTDANHNGKVDDGESGAMPRLLAMIKSMVDTTQQKAGANSVPKGALMLREWSLSQQMDDYDSQIADLQLLLTQKDTALRAQFSQVQQLIMQIQANTASF